MIRLKPKRVAEFEIGQMLPIAFSLVVLGIGVAYGLNVLSDTRDDIGEGVCEDRSDDYTTYLSASDVCANTSNTSQTVQVGTADFNATGDAIDGTAKLPEKLPLIATVVVAAVVIGILVRYLWMR